jgi:hypothetical protein
MTDIADGEVLYRYANPAAFPPGQDEVPLSIFNDPEMSCDWERLQEKPEESLHVKNGRSVIVCINVCDAIRNPVNPKRTNTLVPEWQQKIVHDPLQADPANPFTPNEAHALIKGRKKAAVLDALRENSILKAVGGA